jgi:polysaccharide pyruvyl transferase WcaK-like protein
MNELKRDVTENCLHILVEPSDYILRNTGDMAMMHIAISRLAALWPRASIQVFTRDPTLLAAFCPDAIPLLAPEPRKLASSPLSHFLRQRMGPIVRRLLFWNDLGRQRLWLRGRWPSKSRPRSESAPRRSSDAVLDAISRANVVVVTGMGGVTDAFPEYAMGLLDRLEVAIRSGKLVVMFGQGMGPLRDPELRAKAMAVLPRVGFISLREGRSGVPLLHSLGVDPARLMVTGDDAIEMAAAATTSRLGSGLGINLRAADYADVDSDFVIDCREVLHGAARAYGAPMVPIPISTVPGEEDAITISEMMSGYCIESDAYADVNSPFTVIERINSCRIVFTGSYHAAVFALSMGVSTVCLAKSDYYRDKFAGLADLFQCGCEIVLGQEANWRPKLAGALEQAWRSADEVRPQLLEAAQRQILWSRAAYQKAQELLNAHMQAGDLQRHSYWP